MAGTQSDPRVFFAAERTLLAWVRTGIAIIAIGFVVSRFGLFIHLLAVQPESAAAGEMPADHTVISAALGVAFVVAGTFSIVFAAYQHRRFINTIPFNDRPAAYSTKFAVLLASMVALLGTALTAYLVISQP